MLDLPRSIAFFFSATAVGGGFIAWLTRKAGQAQINKYPAANDNFRAGEENVGE